MLSILENGGPILWIIMILFFLASIIIIERILYFKKIRVDEEKLFNRVRSAIEKNILMKLYLSVILMSLRCPH